MDTVVVEVFKKADVYSYTCIAVSLNWTVWVNTQ